MHQGEQERVERLDHEGQPPASRPRRTRIVIAAGVAVVLVLGSGGAAFAWNADQNEKYAAASEAWSSAAEDEGRVVNDARAVLDASEGRVADDQVRQALAAALDGSDGSDAGHGPDASRSDKIAAFTAWAAASEAKVEQIRTAMAAVVTAQAEWELQQATAGYDDAIAALSAAIDGAAGVLAGSEGKVSDNAVRQTLTDAIDAGNALLDVATPEDVDALTAATRGINEATAALTAASTATTDAQTAWQAEQDRIAAEQAAAAAAAAQAARSSSSSGKSSTTGKSSTGKSSSSGRSSGGTKSGSTSSGSSGGGSAPATGGGSTWGGGWDTSNSDTICHHMDTAGNVWDC